MKAWMAALVLLGSATGAIGATGAGAQDVTASAPSFSIRAIAEIAPEVNGVLQEIAEPAGAMVPQTVDAADQLNRRCGGFTPTIIKEEDALEPGRKIVFYAPCVHFKQTRRALTLGSNLGALAQSSGLRVLDWDKGKVSNSSGVALTVEPTKLPEDGYVTFDRTPIWTEFTLKPHVTADRAQLIDKFAKALKCDNQGDQTEACLDRRGFSILNGSNVGAPPQPAPSPAAPAASPAPDTGDGIGQLAPGLAAPFATAMIGPARFYRSIADAPDTVPEPPASVAASQWPYDPDLVAATLMEARNQGWIADSLPTTIGVADIGLADQDGLPIAPGIFSRNPGEDGTTENGTNNEPDKLDNEPNGFADDFYGAGQIRPGDLQADGNLALCGARTVTLADIESGLGPIADHGSIVASIAVGLALRSKYAGIKGLPKLVFYRLFPQACGAGANTSASEGAVAAGLGYLFDRSPIAVLSFTTIGDQTKLKSEIKDLLANRDRLLVLPAGNEQTGDIDRNKPSPAILGNRNSESGAWRRMLVVGAAGRDLSITDYSGWGFNTVWLYAPGEPVGALGLDGVVIDDAHKRGATSFAAPYVGLAAGMMRAQGMMDINEIRQRLLLATWPIQAGSDKADILSAGVLDLNKAAAVRLTSVELVQQNAGILERRTLVGSFVKPLASTALCRFPPTLSLSGVQAIRISDPRPGDRTLIITFRKADDTGMLAWTPRQCEPGGTVAFKDVRGETIQIDMSQVTAILFPWRPKE